MAATRFAIIQEDFCDIPFLVLKQILCDEGGLTATDAARMARNNCGILTEQLAAPQAAAVVRTLRESGIAARLMPADELTELKRPRTTRWLTQLEDGFLLPWGATNQTTHLPYSSVFVISSAKITVGSENEGARSRDHSSPVANSIHNNPTPLSHITELIGYSGEVGVLHVRLPANELQFARILGPVPLEHRFQKYLHMLDQIVEKCPQAILGPFTRSLLQERKERYETRVEPWQEDRAERRFRQLNRWLLQLALIRERESPAADLENPIV